jgi:hypothetical protein
MRPLAVDKEIIGIAWNAATIRRLQPRALGSLEKTRKVIEEIGKFSLPVPGFSSLTVAVKEQAATPETDSIS